MTFSNRSLEPAGERIAQLLKLVVHHRGPDAEQKLMEAIGEERLFEIYSGQEPRFSELEEISATLSIPISTFQSFNSGDFPQLEIVWAELLYHARSLSHREIEELALRIADLTPTGSHAKSLIRKMGHLPKLPD
ncbi:hypothetical protein [Hyphobacterium sp.]|uniref:hypothetical protein n=1 Tax=Hyphobacterium sp. TaxID=2004662 RepID=UPI003BAD8547